MSAAREIRGPRDEIRVAIADDASLVFSDDYRSGWERGFSSLLNVATRCFDISPLRTLVGGKTLGAYRPRTMAGTPKLLAETVANWKPDLVFCHHGRAASNAQFADVLRRRGIRTAVYLCDEPYESGETAIYSTGFDFVFTMDFETVEAHRLSRQNRTQVVFYLPPAVDTDRFKPQTYEGRSVPALFLGNASLVPRPAYLKPIEKLVDRAQIMFWKPPKKNSKQWVPLDAHARLFGSCVVGLNVHRSPWITEREFSSRVLHRPGWKRVPAGLKLPTTRPTSWGTGFWNDGNLPAAHVNPRFLEMAACGTLVVNDDTRSELARMFPMAPRAESPEHFYELVRYYIDHPVEAEEIGRACSSLISNRHSYRHRAAEVLIRTGFKAQEADDLRLSLGAPGGYLTPQLSELLRVRSSSEQTGSFERWFPRSGMLSIATSGSPSEAVSIDAPPLW